MPEVQGLVDQFGAAAAVVYGFAGKPGLMGKLKSDLTSMDPLTKLLKDIVPGLNDMPEGYKTFGGDDYAAQVRVSPSPDP